MGMRDTYNIFVSETVLEEIKEHARSSQTETGGILLGDLHEDRGSIEVTNIIPAQHTVSKESKITFTPATWKQIKKEKRERFSDKEILGWYHSHTNKNAYTHFSDADIKFHRMRFKKPWRIAIVYDAVRGHYGVYKWRDGRVVRCTFTLVESKC